MQKRLLFGLFMAFLAQKAVAQDDEKFRPQAWLGASAGLQTGQYKFTTGGLYAQSPFDRTNALEVGLDFRPQIAEHGHLAIGAHFFNRKMRADGEFAVLVPGLGEDVFYKIDGHQSFLGGNLGFGLSHELSSGLRPYLEAGVIFDFPLQDSVAQTQTFFGLSKPNALLAGKEAFGGYGELGLFWPLGQRLRLSLAGRYAATQTSVKVFENVAFRTVSQNMYVRRWALRVGLERRF